jgi:hypothetical protein
MGGEKKMTLPIQTAHYRLNKVIEELKTRVKVKSVLKQLKTDYGQKIPSVSVEKSYALIVTNKGEMLKISLKDLI